MSHLPESPVNPLPPAVTALFLVLMGIELVFQMGENGFVGGPQAVGWRLGALQTYAFSGDILHWMVETGQYPARHLIRFVSYPFVHVSFTNALIAGVFVLAMGKMVAEIFGGLQMIAVFLIASIAGASIYALTGAEVPLIGAFPAVYGLIGTYTYLLWRGLASVGQNQSKAFTLIAFLMGVQLIFAVFTGSKEWVADIGGFAAGFAVSFFLTPGGWPEILRRTRGE